MHCRMYSVDQACEGMLHPGCIPGRFDILISKPMTDSPFYPQFWNAMHPITFNLHLSKTYFYCTVFLKNPYYNIQISIFLIRAEIPNFKIIYNYWVKTGFSKQAFKILKLQFFYDGYISNWLCLQSFYRLPSRQTL